jgi:hypothetical protein
VNVPAAPSVHATATHPTNGARGDEDGGPLAAVGTLTIDVALERLGTVSGTVFGPDGQTPVDGVESAHRRRHNPRRRPVPFTNLKLGTHTLSAYVGGRLRAQASVLLNGPEASKNLVLVGVGTEARSRSGGPAVDAGIAAERRADLAGSSIREIGRGSAGPSVPIGSFTISATLGADTAEGRTSRRRRRVTSTRLLDNAIALPGPPDGNDLGGRSPRRQLGAG